MLEGSFLAKWKDVKGEVIVYLDVSKQMFWNDSEQDDKIQIKLVFLSFI